MGANPGSAAAPLSAIDSTESSSSSSLAPIWIGVAIAVAVAIGVAWNVYRSTTQYADAFEAMMDTSARVQALDHARADRTLLAVSFQTYQLGGERTALTIVPLAAKLSEDLERVRTLTAAETLQQHRLDQIDAQLAEFNRLYHQMTRLESNPRPHPAQRPAEIETAAALLDTLRVELAGMSAEEFRVLASQATRARTRAGEGQFIGAVGSTLVIAWLLVVVGWGAGMVRRLDHKAAQVRAGEHALRQVNAALESRVQSRTAALAEQRELLESILHAMSEAVVAVNSEGELRTSNAAAEVMFGARLRNQTNLLAGYELIDRDRALPIIETNSPLRRVIEGEQFGELRLCKHDVQSGELRWFEGSVRRIENKAEPAGGAVMVLRDITDRETAREELKRARDVALEDAARRAEFVSRTGHQVRTLLGAITGRVDLLLLADLGNEQRRQAESIKSSADLLSTIVNDVYDFSMLSISKLTVRRVNFDLVPMVEEVIESLAESARARGVELGLFIDSALPANLRGDPNRLKQVLYNLLTNVIRYAANGALEVSVGKLEESQSEVMLDFQVQNAAGAIPAELRRRLFDPSITFEAPSDPEGATGLGLMIAGHLIRRMNGSIGFESEPGGGSTLHFSVRLDKASDERVAARFGFSGSRHVGARMLIVGAASHQREAAARYLAAWGLAPVVAETCAAAIEQSISIDHDPHKFLGVLIDEQVEGQSCATVAEAIRAAYDLRPIKIIVASTDPARQHSANVDYWIRKPLMPTRLTEVINELVSPPPKPGALSPSAPLINSPEVRILRGVTRVLAVDDDAVTRSLLSEELEVLGFHADVVKSGQEALQLFDRESYDIVLMDIAMPQMDGYEAATLIRRCEPSEHRAVIIAFSAYPTEAMRRRAEEVGMDDFIAKPVALAELADVLDTWAQRIPRAKAAAANGDLAAMARDFDAQKLADIRQLSAASGHNVLAKLIDTFLADLPERLTLMDSAMEREDFESFAAAAFALRGSSTAIGATQLAELCATAEKLAQNGDRSAARASALNLIRYVRSLPEVLRRAASASAS
jgi:two-component system, sensor histidine kinase and response regulator